MGISSSDLESVESASRRESSVRRQMAAAAARIRRLKQIDRMAVGIITLGGLAVVVGVIGILVFIAAEAVPLFRSAKAVDLGTFALASPTAKSTAEMAALGVDEGSRYVYAIDTAGSVAFFNPGTGARVLDRPLPALGNSVITASSRSLSNDFVAAGTNDGRVALLQVRFTPSHQEGDAGSVDVDVVEQGLVKIDPQGRAVRRVAYRTENDRRFVAAQVSDAELAFWWTDGSDGSRQEVVGTEGKGNITSLSLGGNGTAIAGTDGGEVLFWELGDDVTLVESVKVASTSITALGFLIGGRTFVAGTANGQVSAWFQAPVGADESMKLIRSVEFEPQGEAITAVAASTRDRTFATGSADGRAVLRHQTSGRTLLKLGGDGPVSHIVITPRGDGVFVARRDGAIDRFALSNPHPEVSWSTLFSKVWYEGYPRPEFVWQSTGANDAFEPKLSVAPLVFGTIKGTFYALIFAIPLAVLGALYTSQFVHPSIRAKIKPAVEVMAALPSVVIGFIGGLYLAPAVERNLVGVILLFVILPVFGISGVLFWKRLPQTFHKRLKPGSELFVIAPMLVIGAWVALTIAPAVEAAVFAGDARQWLSTTLGVTYDQRNSLVVGLAMGFAVIPIIFTISEDAFSSVPSSLSAASLALGASRWQTAVRVVIPTASPAVFSAIMVGFGRAVGETMIVLMATGNTPVLDWSIFNGFRTLSANIAVEISEAPQGGTLYRTLFLSGALLFVMTFTLNTIAEVIRQRLRERYRAV